jgi:hypothetical protein
MTNFRHHLQYKADNASCWPFEPIAVNGLLFWLDAAPLSDPPTCVKNIPTCIEDITRWQVCITLESGDHSLGPADLPELFAHRPWTRHWRARQSIEGNCLHSGEHVTTEDVAEMLSLAEMGMVSLDWFRHDDTVDPHIQAMIEQHEDEQRQREIEWEVDRALGFKRFEF